MDYISAKEASVLWNITDQMIRRHCRNGRIPGSVQRNGTWYVPADAKKPTSIVIDEESSTGDLVTITEITGWQIVNGGQTTASIYNAFQAKLPLDAVNVQIKLSVIKAKEQAEDIIHNISKYANSQNKINMSDFNANDAYGDIQSRFYWAS